MADNTIKQRQQRLRDKRRAEGWKLKQIWIKPDGSLPVDLKRIDHMIDFAERELIKNGSDYINGFAMCLSMLLSNESEETIGVYEAKMTAMKSKVK